MGAGDVRRAMGECVAVVGVVSSGDGGQATGGVCVCVCVLCVFT